MTSLNQPQGTEVLPQWAGKLVVVLKILTKFMPKSVAAFMARMWFKPFMPKQKAHVLKWAESADQTYSFKKGQVTVFGDEKLPLVVCVHGWRGRAHQLRRFVAPLQAKGFRVGLVDLPGHCDDSENQTHAYECAEFIQAIWREVGDVDSIIAHSFGAAASVLSFSEACFKPRKFASLAGNFDLQYLLDQYARAFDLEKLRPEIERHIIKISDKRIFSGALKQFTMDKVEDYIADTNVYFWHDIEEREINIPANQALARNLSNAQESEVEGVGHFDILRSEQVITEVCDYLSE